MNKLYKLSRNNNEIEEWQITTDKDTYTVTYGQLNGKLTSKTTRVKGKNIGRSNETTPEQQAILEAQSKYNLKLRKGYVENIHLVSIKQNAYEPMLAQKFKQPVKCGYMQEKINGYRCVYNPDLKVLFTRGNKTFNIIPHILDACIKIGLPLDGELIWPGHSFQELKSVLGRDDCHPRFNEIEFHVFDIVCDGDFGQRLEKLQKIAPTFPFCIKLVPTIPFDNWDIVNDYFNKVSDNKGEGVILRVDKCLYKPGSRCKDLIKYKNFEDAEFEIIGCEEDKNGNCVFICKTESGVEFNVTPEGSFEEKRDYLININDYIGKYLNVRHIGWTEDGKPFHAVGVYIREDI